MSRPIIPVMMMAAALAVASARAASASEDPIDVSIPRPTTEGYVGFLLPYQRLGGDLDGTGAYANDDGTAIVPDLDSALGAGLVIGLKNNRPSGRAFAIEGSIQGSRHRYRTSGGGPTGNADFGLISGDFKFFPTAGGAAEPWLQIGLCAASLDVRDGFFAAGGGRKDATFSGSGINLGAGLLMYASPRVAFHVAAIYRAIGFNEVDYGRRARLKDDLRAPTVSLEFGATFRFARH